MGSLDAVELASDLERWLNRRLSPTAIYNHPNIDALAKWLRTTSQPTVAGAPRSTSPAATASSPAATAPFVESGTTSAAVAISAASAANLRSDAAMLDEVRQSTDDELAAFIAESMAKFSDQETPS
jgi:hypothetical protein